MRVFSMWDPANPMREVDLFVEHPIAFAELWERSEVMSLESTEVRVASIDDLIALKRSAGREVDRRDIEAPRGDPDQALGRGLVRHREGKPSDDWGASWEATRRRQLALGLAVAPAERLRWLEGMIRLAHASGALPRARDENGDVIIMGGQT